MGTIYNRKFLTGINNNPSNIEAYELYKDILLKNPDALVSLYLDDISFEEGVSVKLSLLHNIQNPLILAGYPNILEECYFDKHAKELDISSKVWDEFIEPLRIKYPNAFVPGEFIVDTENKVSEADRDQLREAIRNAAIKMGHDPLLVDRQYGMKIRFKQFDEKGLSKKVSIPLANNYNDQANEEMYRNRHAYDIVVQSPLTNKNIRVRLCGQSPVIRDDYKFVGYGVDTLNYFSAALINSDVVIIRGNNFPKELSEALENSKARIIKYNGSDYYTYRP